MWLVGLCAGVGGIIATSNIIALLLKWVVSTICRFIDRPGQPDRKITKENLNTVKSSSSNNS